MVRGSPWCLHIGPKSKHLVNVGGETGQPALGQRTVSVSVSVITRSAHPGSCACIPPRCSASVMSRWQLQVCNWGLAHRSTPSGACGFVIKRSHEEKIWHLCEGIQACRHHFSHTSQATSSSAYSLPRSGVKGNVRAQPLIDPGTHEIFTQATRDRIPRCAADSQFHVSIVDDDKLYSCLEDRVAKHPARLVATAFCAQKVGSVSYCAGRGSSQFAVTICFRGRISRSHDPETPETFPTSNKPCICTWTR